MTPDVEFSTGATRSSDADALRFDLIHPVALVALARTYAEGAAKYGDSNWERGMPVHDLLNHALRHIYLFLAGDRSEPHLPHAAWGVMSAIVSDALWPELNAPYLRGPGCTLTDAVLDRQAAMDPGLKARRDSGGCAHLEGWDLREIPEVARILNQQRTLKETPDGEIEPNEFVD